MKKMKKKKSKFLGKASPSCALNNTNGCGMAVEALCHEPLLFFFLVSICMFTFVVILFVFLFCMVPKKSTGVNFWFDKYL